MERLYSPGQASRLPRLGAESSAATTQAATHLAKNHRWKAGEGEKGTITVEYQPPASILRYLSDMRDALRGASPKPSYWQE